MSNPLLSEVNNNQDLLVNDDNEALLDVMNKINYLEQNIEGEKKDEKILSGFLDYLSSKSKVHYNNLVKVIQDYKSTKNQISSLLELNSMNSTLSEIKPQIKKQLDSIKEIPDKLNEHITNLVDSYNFIIMNSKVKERLVLLKDENKSKLKLFFEKDYEEKVKSSSGGKFTLLYKEISLLVAKNAINLIVTTMNSLKNLESNIVNANTANQTSQEETNLIDNQELNIAAMEEVVNQLKVLIPKDSDLLVNLVFNQCFGFSPISDENYFNAEMHVADENTNEKRRVASLFYNSIYFGVFFKFIHSTNSYVVQPDLSLYLEALGFSEYYSGYVVALMHFAKLLSCFLFTLWTNNSYKNPYLFATVCMILANLVYFLTYYQSNMYFSFILILVSRVLVGFGSAKIIIKRLSIDFSSYYDLFYFSGMLMLFSNLGHAMGPLVNLFMYLFVDSDNSYKYVLPSLCFVVVWIIIGAYLYFSFKDPYDIKKELEENTPLNKKYNEEEVEIQDRIVSANSNSNQRPTITNSFNIQLSVLLLMILIFRGIIEFQLWSIPILMEEVFAVDYVASTIYTIITFSCCNIFI